MTRKKITTNRKKKKDILFWFLVFFEHRTQNITYFFFCFCFEHTWMEGRLDRDYHKTPTKRERKTDDSKIGR